MQIGKMKTLFNNLKSHVQLLKKKGELKNYDILHVEENSLCLSKKPEDPNGFYSRIELSIDKNDILTKKSQNFIENPAEDEINAHPFGYETFEPVSEKDLPVF
jgi:hypothetical protein